MKIDLWTKVVFTVIAVCLVVLAVRSLQVIPVQATSYLHQGAILKVDVVRIGGRPIFLNDILGR